MRQAVSMANDSVTQNVVPCPFADVQEMVPPMASTSFFTMDRPVPLPSYTVRAPARFLRDFDVDTGHVAVVVDERKRAVLVITDGKCFGWFGRRLALLATSKQRDGRGRTRAKRQDAKPSTKQCDASSPDRANTT